MQRADLPPPNSKHAALCASPKRKRSLEDDVDMVDEGRSPLRLRTDLPSSPMRDDVVHEPSPRTKMSNQMQTLDIKHEHKIPHLSFRSKIPPGDAPPHSPGSHPSSGLPDYNNNNAGPTAPPTLRLETASLPEFEVPETPQASFSTSSQHASAALEPPQTPTLRPAPSPQSAPQTISPLPPSSPATSLSTPPSPSPTPTVKRSVHFHQPQPPTHQLPPPISTSLACRSTSPPPASHPPTSAPNTTTTPTETDRAAESASPLTPSDLVWSDAEITGHDPTDPEDDGYGINGIGFRPTAAMAQARSEKRKQQMAEWRRREAGEARQRRAQNRQRGVGGRRLGAGSGAGGVGNGEACEGLGEGGERRVRFVEG